jgi:hypothetical protein
VHASRTSVSCLRLAASPPSSTTATVRYIHPYIPTLDSPPFSFLGRMRHPSQVICLPGEVTGVSPCARSCTDSSLPFLPSAPPSDRGVGVPVHLICSSVSQTLDRHAVHAIICPPGRERITGTMLMNPPTSCIAEESRSTGHLKHLLGHLDGPGYSCLMVIPPMAGGCTPTVEEAGQYGRGMTTRRWEDDDDGRSSSCRDEMLKRGKGVWW